MTVFRDHKEYRRFIRLLDYYRFANTPMRYSDFIHLSEKNQTELLIDLKKEQDVWIQIYTFILMPNHFHLCLKQLVDGGISNFLRHVENSYTRYINTKNDRVGPQFQGRFKSVLVETEEQLLHLSRYQHLNIYTDGIVNTIEELTNYPYSSFPYYLGSKKDNFIDTEFILAHFKNSNAYKRFVLSNRGYQRSLSKLKKLINEDT